MITKSMTSEELLKELCVGEGFILDRTYGLRIKNNKKLKSKYVKHNEIMSVSNYIIPETQNNAVVYAVKQYQTLKGKDYATMYLSYYYKTAYGTFIMPYFNNSVVVGYLEATCHAVDRMKMRLGKDFDAFFREDWLKKNDSAMSMEEYDYNGDKNEYVAHVGDAFLILENTDSGKKKIIKTVLSTNDLHANQLQYKLDSKMRGESFRDEVADHIDAVTEAHLKMFKKMGIVRKVI